MLYTVLAYLMPVVLLQILLSLPGEGPALIVYNLLGPKRTLVETVAVAMILTSLNTKWIDTPLVTHAPSEGHTVPMMNKTQL